MFDKNKNHFIDWMFQGRIVDGIAITRTDSLVKQEAGKKTNIPPTFVDFIDGFICAEKRSEHTTRVMCSIKGVVYDGMVTDNPNDSEYYKWSHHDQKFTRSSGRHQARIAHELNHHIVQFLRDTPYWELKKVIRVYSDEVPNEVNVLMKLNPNKFRLFSDQDDEFTTVNRIALNPSSLLYVYEPANGIIFKNEQPLFQLGDKEREIIKAMCTYKTSDDIVITPLM